MHIESHFASRSIASETTSSHPKYEARASKIDRTKIEIDKDLDLTCFSERGDAYRTRLLEERKNYKVDLVDKDGVAAQKIRIESLVSGLVDLEVDMAALKEKKAWVPEGEEIANNTMNELKTTLESLLQDEVENEVAVLKDQLKKEETPVVVEEEPVVVKEETAKDDTICDLEEKNKVLTEQVEKLMAEQKKIMETMLGMNNMMLQMFQMQNQQQQYTIPSWLMAGSLVNPQFQYGQNTQPIIIMNGYGQQGQQDYSFQNSQYNQLGQQAYQQYGQSNQFQYQQPSYQMPEQYSAQAFGPSPYSYNFGGNNNYSFKG